MSRAKITYKNKQKKRQDGMCTDVAETAPF